MLFTIVVFRWVIYCAKKYSFAGSSNPEYSLFTTIIRSRIWEFEPRMWRMRMQMRNGKWKKRMNEEIKMFRDDQNPFRSVEYDSSFFFSWCPKTQESRRRQCFDCVSISFKCMQQTIAIRFEHAMNRGTNGVCFVYMFYLYVWRKYFFFFSFFFHSSTIN